MVSKDQSIGGAICLICVVVGVLYTLGLFYYGIPGDWQIAFTLVAIPVFIAFIAILGIGAWIGWTMATTPPPKPIEEITAEMEPEKKETVEEKPAVAEQPVAEEKPAEQPVEEEKKPERKRKTP